MVNGQLQFKPNCVEDDEHIEIPPMASPGKDIIESPAFIEYKNKLENTSNWVDQIVENNEDEQKSLYQIDHQLELQGKYTHESLSKKDGYFESKKVIIAIREYLHHQ